MSRLTDSATPAPRRSIRWKRWVIVDLVIAGIMTYIEVAFLGIIGKIINAVFDTNAGDQPVLMVLFGIFAFLVNLLVAAIFTVVIGVFVSFFTAGSSGKSRNRDKTTAGGDPDATPHQTEP